MNNLEKTNNNNNGEGIASQWLSDEDMLGDLESEQPKEIDRSTYVGEMMGATLDIYENAAKLAESSGLSEPFIPGSGAMYLYAIARGGHTMAELNIHSNVRRNLPTTSHGMDIDVAFSSEAEVNRVVEMSGCGKRQIALTDKTGIPRMADVMSRTRLPGFEPITVQFTDGQVRLQNPDEMIFEKINTLSSFPPEQIQQKWGYDIPLIVEAVEDHRQGDESLDDYLTRRYSEYSKAVAESGLSQMPAEARLGDIITADNIRRMLPNADDVLVSELMDFKVGDINVDDLPNEAFASWDEVSSKALSNYQQANELAEKRLSENK